MLHMVLIDDSRVGILRAAAVAYLNVAHLDVGALGLREDARRHHMLTRRRKSRRRRLCVRVHRDRGAALASAVAAAGNRRCDLTDVVVGEDR
eukprot:3768092-Prymnesium_polylepis.1